MVEPLSKRKLPRKLAKGGTASSRKHRFESFNQRIAKLKIDPIRRKRRDAEEGGAIDGLSSYFADSLERWRYLNLSANFSSFLAEVGPLCHTLPQVLHHENDIFAVLVQYVEKQDVLSLEPLLDLLSSLVRDLGSRFEHHFAHAVELVASTAAHHSEVEAIEWSYTCLSWLFKYLSRLLTPNLQPVFQLMAPLLGKEPQKAHTTKFAAEAMSFLVRRAANTYERDVQPLHIVIDAMREDLIATIKDAKSSDVNEYKHGLMSLLANTVKGVDRKLHSCAVHVYHCFLENVTACQSGAPSDLLDVLIGLTTALVHHTDADGLKPIVNLVLKEVNSANLTSSDRIICLANLLNVFSTVRKGTRIQDWHELVDANSMLLANSTSLDLTQVEGVFKTAGVIFQSAPFGCCASKISGCHGDHHRQSVPKPLPPFLQLLQ